MISHNSLTGSITGTLKTLDGRSFALETCHDHFIFEEFDLTSFEEEELSGEVEEDFVLQVPPPAGTRPVSRAQSSEQRSYSVMFYYTPEFAAATPNIEAGLDTLHFAPCTLSRNG